MGISSKQSRSRWMVWLGMAFLCASGAAQTATRFAGTTPVGQSTAAAAVTVTMVASGVAAAPQVLMQGLAGADFVAASGGTCAAGAAYSVGQTCTVQAIFEPRYPGVRRGAVVLRAASGALLGMTPLTGIATGSLPILAPGQIDTVAGNTAWVYAGDGGPATSSPIFLPTGVVVDAAGTLYLSDSQNNRVRRVDAVTQGMTTVAGTGTPGYEGDNIAGTSTPVSAPAGLALDGAGNLYIADTNNHIIRRVDAVTGIITTVAGSPGVQGYTGDGGPATQARLSFPEGIAFDLAGDLIVADTGNNVVRLVDAASGVIRTLAGTGAAGYNGDGQPATAAALNSPWSVAVAQDGSLYIADLNNDRVRWVDVAGIMHTVAGTGTRGFGGDGGAPAAAMLNAPAEIVLDPAGDLYIADSGNNRLREIDVATGLLTTISGNGSEQFTGDAGPANAAGLYGPYALYFTSAGDLYVADMFHNRIRHIAALKTTLTYAAMKVGKVSAPQPVQVANAGNANLQLKPPTLVNAAEDAVSTTCAAGASIVPGAVCTVGAAFSPTVIGNPVDGSIAVTSDALSTPVILMSGQVLSITPTTTAVVSSANPGQLGTTVTFTATVVNDGSTLTGTVAFLDGTTQLCSVTVASFKATCAVSTLALGQHSITASYSGDANNAASVSAALLEVIKQPVTASLAAAPNPVVVTGSVTLTATVTAQTGTPGGTVTFYDGTSALGVAALDAQGVAVCTTTQLTPGTHALTGQYSGDAADLAATTNLVSEVVQQAATSTLLGASSMTATVGVPVTLTAQVSSSNGPTPTGTVQFNQGTTSLGSVTLGAGGTASLTVNSLAPGAQPVAAIYSGDTDDATSTSATLTLTIQQAATSTTLAADANPVAAGATLHLTATVSAAGANPGAGALIGNVAFTDGTNALGMAALDASGHAVLSVSTLAAGPHAIVAAFAGSTNYAGSQSAALAEVVQTTATATALSVSTIATPVGQPVVLSATVSSGTGVPAGAVTFLDGSTTLGQGTLNAQGQATLSVATLTVGIHSLTATYAGSALYATSTSAAIAVTVSPASTATALTSSANPAVLGQSVVFSATVTSAGAGLGGTVSFMDGAAVLGSATLGSNGVATLAISTLTFGPHAISALYSGDANHAASSSIAITEQIVQPALIALNSSANPALAGANVTFTAAVSGSLATVPAGNVVFSDGATTLGSVALNASGTAGFSTAALAVGTHAVTARYSGDANYFTATANLVQVVQIASTQVSLTAAANPATYGTALVLTARVTDAGGIASGTVSFADGGTALGTGVLDATGTATLSTAALTPGPHTITANYLGSTSNGASTSSPLVVSVKQTANVSLASSANPSPTLNSITWTATIASNGPAVATGSVTFMDGATQLGAAPLDANGQASWTAATMSAGTHAMQAIYAGDAGTFAASSATVSQTVQLRPTTMSLTAVSVDPENPLQITLIAVVRWTGAVTPTGTVSFAAGTQTLGSVAVDATGVATLSVVLQSASQSIVATYSGDTAYAGSSSPPTTISSGTVPQVTLQLDPASATIASKQHLTVNLTVAAAGTFSDTLQLGCVGLPYAATCTFSTPQVKLGAGATATVQVVVDTGNPLGAGASARLAGSRTPGTLLCFLPFALLLGLGARRRTSKTAALMMALLLMAAATHLTGCSALQQNGTPAGTYAFKVTAVGANTGITASQTMTLTVTQ